MFSGLLPLCFQEVDCLHQAHLKSYNYLCTMRIRLLWYLTFPSHNNTGKIKPSKCPSELIHAEFLVCIELQFQRTKRSISYQTSCHTRITAEQRRIDLSVMNWHYDQYCTSTLKIWIYRMLNKEALKKDYDTIEKKRFCNIESQCSIKNEWKKSQVSKSRCIQNYSAEKASDE